MKKRYSIALLVLGATLLSSCGFNVLNKADFDNYKKDGALRELNNNDYFLEKSIKYDDKLEAVGDFYKIDRNRYKSFLSDKVISSTRLLSFQIGAEKQHTIYYDEIHRDVFYDSFGDQIQYLSVYPDKDIFTSEYKIIAAECSTFYRKISGKKSNSQKLHIIDATKISLSADSIGDAGYILKEEGDTHFRARNYWLDISDKGKKSFDFHDTDICIPVTEDLVIEKLDDYEFVVNNERRYTYSLPKGYNEFTYTPAISVSYESSNKPNSENVFNLLTVRFTGTSELFQYFLAEYNIGERPDNFTFVDEGKYYLSFIIKDGLEYEVDYVPVLPLKYKMSADNSSLFIQVRKIKDKMIDIVDADSYLININKDFERSQFYKDDKFIDDETQYYYFHDTYHSFPVNSTIDSLNKEALTLKQANSDYVFITNKGGIFYNYGYTNLFNTQISFNHYYSFVSVEEGVLLLFDAKNNYAIDPYYASSFIRPPENKGKDYIFNTVVSTIIAAFVKPDCVEINEARECISFGDKRISFIFSSSEDYMLNNTHKTFGYFITYTNSK